MEILLEPTSNKLLVDPHRFEDGGEDNEANDDQESNASGDASGSGDYLAFFFLDFLDFNYSCFDVLGVGDRYSVEIGSLGYDSRVSISSPASKTSSLLISLRSSLKSSIRAQKSPLDWVLSTWYLVLVPEISVTIVEGNPISVSCMFLFGLRGSVGVPSSKRYDVQMPSLGCVAGNLISVGCLFPYESLGSVGLPFGKDFNFTATPSTPLTTTTIYGDEDLTIAQILMKIRSEKAKEKEKGVVLIDEEEPPRLNRSTTTLQPLLTIDQKDKGKGVLVKEELEKPVKVKRRDQGLAQIESDAELAQRLHEEELAEINADHELDVRLTHEEQEKYTIEERAKLLAEFFERRKKQLAAERAETIRNKPPTRTQVRNKMITHLKHMAESTKKRPRADSEEESFKKQKLEEDNDAKKEELRYSMDVVPRDDVAIDVESLATKYPIVDWKTHILNENMMYYQIIRADGSSKNYKIFSEMLDDFDRQDVIDLHSWRLFNSCGVYILLMNTGVAIHMMIEKKYRLTQEMLSRMLNKRLEVDYESEMAFELLRFTRSQL
ncbi:hypothetical protein Tco_0523673 [Tanacetum coccineum]